MRGGRSRGRERLFEVVQRVKEVNEQRLRLAIRQRNAQIGGHKA